jgi:hypothetical protein
VAEIGPWLAKTYGTLASVITAYGAYPAGLPFAGTSGSPSRPDFPGAREQVLDLSSRKSAEQCSRLAR